MDRNISIHPDRYYCIIGGQQTHALHRCTSLHACIGRPAGREVTMIPDAELLTRALLIIDAQAIHLRHRCMELDYLLSTGDSLLVANAMLGLHKVLEIFASTILSLRARVLTQDELIFGTTPGCLGELVIRAQTAVITLQLRALRNAVGALAHDQAILLSGSRFRKIDELSLFIVGELARVNGMWTPFVKHQRPDAGPFARTPGGSYRHAIRSGQRELRAVGDDADIAKFLSAGVLRVDQPGVQTACAHMQTMFMLAFDVELDHETFWPSPKRLTAQASNCRPASRT